MRRVGYAVLLLGAAVVVIVSLVPISGRNLGVTKVDVDCGPALGAAQRWTGPGANERSDGPGIETGPDTGITKAAWCEGEAGRWLRPAAGAAGLLALSGTALIGWSTATHRARRRGDP